MYSYYKLLPLDNLMLSLDPTSFGMHMPSSEV